MGRFTLVIFVCGVILVVVGKVSIPIALVPIICMFGITIHKIDTLIEEAFPLEEP